jgi:hypothetical protein
MGRVEQEEEDEEDGDNEGDDDEEGDEGGDEDEDEMLSKVRLEQTEAERGLIYGSDGDRNAGVLC